MAKSTTVAALVATLALCQLLTLAVAAARQILTVDASQPQQDIIVEGTVYCDTCRVQFETPLSHRIEGATVTLLCKDRITENVTVEIDTKTNKAGEYAIKVEGDHSTDICQVHLTSPGSDGCTEIVAELNAMRILLSHDAGVTGLIRKANPLGFMSAQPLENCADTLKSMGFLSH